MWEFYSPQVRPKSHFLLAFTHSPWESTCWWIFSFMLQKWNMFWTTRSNDDSFQGLVSQVELLTTRSLVHMLWSLFLHRLECMVCVTYRCPTAASMFGCPFLSACFVLPLFATHLDVLIYVLTREFVMTWLQWLGCVIVLYCPLDACFELPLGYNVFGCLALP
jgi:hypothetical protein